MSDLLQMSDEGIMEIARQLRVGYELKRVLRYGTTRDHSVHNESDAEHIFALDYLADYFIFVEKLPRGLDEIRVRRMIRYHDFPELKHGDIPYIFKTSEDEERERAAARGVFDSLPEPIRTIGYNSWKEYEDRETLEAQFVYGLDKLDPCFELLDPVNERTPMRLQQTYESHMGKKLRATEKFPVMRRFVEVISADLFKRGIFWVKQAAE